MLHRFGTALCVTMLLSTFSANTAAEPSSGRAKSTPPADATSSVADHVRRGDRARLLGRWSDAAAAYAEALAVAEGAGFTEEKRATIVGELGAAEAALKKYRDAAEHLHWSLTYDTVLTAEQKARYGRALDKVAAEVAVLAVVVHPSDAELLVDGTPIPERRSSHILFLEPGPLTFRARLSGFADGTTRQDVPKGTKSSLGLELVELPPAPKPAPLAPRPVTVTAGQDKGARFRTPVFIMAGGAVLLGGGLLGAAIAVNDSLGDKTADLKSRAGTYTCTTGNFDAECAALESQIGTRDTLARVGWGALAVGAGLGVVGLGSFLFDASDKNSTRVGLVPGGIVVHSEF